MQAGAMGSGFCTFNGLVIAAQALRLNGAKKVGILDMDQHYGDGTENIIKKLELDYIKHWTLGGSSVNQHNADEFFENFTELLEKTFKGCSVILYQAGADPHVNDPLGGRLTSDQLRLRDHLVFEFCKKNNIGVAFNLAGGYQNPLRKVLDIHDATLIEAGLTYEIEQEYVDETEHAVIPLNTVA